VTGLWRPRSKAALAVAAILATPLFFVGLMAVSLAVEKPSVHEVLRKGRLVRVLGDPTGSTEARIWLLAVVAPLALLVVGAASTLLGRFGVASSALCAIALSVALMIPLDTWSREHSARFPLGVDNIPPSSKYDIYLRGEWEGTAKRTAMQLGLATIAIAGTSLAALALLEIRRRRGSPYNVPPPPVELITGGPPSATGS
jgi:hypothetical protein